MKSWNDTSGYLVEQRGINNAQSVLNWISIQQRLGFFSNPIDDYLLMGNSAGAVGSPVWANKVFSTLNSTKNAVVPDSFILSMPTDLEGTLLRDAGRFCLSELLPPRLLSNCAAGILNWAGFDYS